MCFFFFQSCAASLLCVCRLLTISVSPPSAGGRLIYKTHMSSFGNRHRPTQKSDSFNQSSERPPTVADGLLIFTAASLNSSSSLFITPYNVLYKCAFFVYPFSSSSMCGRGVCFFFFFLIPIHHACIITEGKKIDPMTTKD